MEGQELPRARGPEPAVSDRHRDTSDRGRSEVARDAAPHDPEAFTEALRAQAHALGLTAIGVTDAASVAHAPFFQRWIERGYHGEMAYLARPEAVARRREPRASLEGARSVVVAVDTYPAGGPPGVPDDLAVGVVARYARGRDYHRVLEGKLRRLARWVEEALADDDGPEEDGEGIPPGAGRDVPTGGRNHPEAGGAHPGEHRRRTRVYVDTGPLLERSLASRAGLGWFGRNTMLIHPRRGSYFFLGALLLDIRLPPDEPFATDHCGSCRACLDACPTGALLGRDDVGAPIMDARRCISYLTIEHRGAIPEQLRPAIGNRIFGCDICQEVCPFSIKFSKPSSEPRYSARGPGEPPVGVEPDPTLPSGWHPGTRSPALVDLFRTALDGASWESFSRGSPIRRAGREGFARNVAVALGNWGDPAAVPVLSQGLEDAHPLVRAHAAWALGRVGSAEAIDALRDAGSREPSESVLAEIDRALEGSPPGRR